MVQPGADNEKQMLSFFAVSCTYHTIVNTRNFHWDKQLQIVLGFNLYSYTVPMCNCFQTGF